MKYYTYNFSDNMSEILNLPLRHTQKLSDQEFEQVFIEHTGKYIPGCQQGELNAHYGKRHSEETKKILSEKAKQRTGWTHTEKTKQKISRSNTGKNHTEETKKKLSETRMGKNNPFYGRKQTEEAKEKVRQAKLKYWENRRNGATVQREI